MNRSNPPANKKILLDTGGGNKPVIRAMGANACLLVVLWFIAMSALGSKDQSIPIVIEFILFLASVFLVRAYVSFIARIIIEEQRIQVICSLHTATIRREMIAHMKLHRSKITSVLKIKIYGKEKEKKWTFRSMQILENDDMEFLKSSWVYEIGTLDGKPLSPDGYIH